MTGTRTRWGKIGDRVLIALAVVFTFLALRGIASINQDGDAINRGQQATNCIGDRQDQIDKWRAVATYEFTHQTDRAFDGIDPDVTVAERAERAIYALVDAKQDIREYQQQLIADGETDFDCPDIDDQLLAPPLPDP